MEERSSSRYLTSRSRRSGTTVVLAAIALIAAATLTGSSDTAPPPWCFHCALASEGFAADLIVNVLLFVPLGLGLRLAGLSVMAVVAGAFTVSLLVELTQAYIIAGRVANVFDLATNTLGATIAAIVTPQWRAMIMPTANAAMSMIIGSVAVVVLILAVTAWALTPAVPGGRLVACRIDAAGASTQPERVLSAVVDGVAVSPQDTAHARGVHIRPIQVDVALQVSGLRWRDEPAFMLVANGETFIQLGIDGNDLELEVRRRGEAARFRSPSVRVRRPARLSESAARARLDTLRLHGVADQWRMSLAVRAHETDDSLRLRLHPIAGWSLFLNAPRSSWMGEVLTALWTAALLFPVGFWSAAAFTGRMQVMRVLPPLLVVAAMWSAGALVGAPALPLSAIIAAVVAVVGAWGLRRRLEGADRRFR